MSKKSIFASILLSVTIILTMIVFIISTNLTKNFDIKEEDEILTQSDQVQVEDLIITETKDAQKYWEIYAKSGTYQGDKNTIILSEIKGNFYQDGKVVLSFDAPTGSYLSNNKKIQISSGARILTDKQVYVEADKLYWTGKEEDITAEGNVKIEKANEIKTISDKCIFNADFTKFKMIGNSIAKLYN
ncbi:MAG: LPS export ABC transporter periplasmic protein LptC [Candidatus Gastranaerophilales bacterium]|nr:LPS export ABC transporter periplasmic protein LptC [Candidatus Gastranaerophilales bacterium]